MLTLFWGGLRNGWVGKILCIVIFAICISGFTWMCRRNSKHSSLNESLYWNRMNTHAAHNLWGMCSVFTPCISFLLKVKPYHLSVTMESVSVHQFQATSWKRRCVFNIASLCMLDSSALETGQQTLLMQKTKISMLSFWSKNDWLSIYFLRQHQHQWQHSPMRFPVY